MIYKAKTGTYELSANITKLGIDEDAIINEEDKTFILTVDTKDSKQGYITMAIPDLKIFCEKILEIINEIENESNHENKDTCKCAGKCTCYND